MQFYADDHLCERLKNAALKRDITVSQLVVETLRCADLEAEPVGIDSLSRQMAEILDSVSAYVALCKQDETKPRFFALREAIPNFQEKYPMHIERDGQRIRNSEGGRVGRQFYHLVSKGRVPNVRNTKMLDRSRTVLYEVVFSAIME
jgi:hypothetical protein